MVLLPVQTCMLTLYAALNKLTIPQILQFFWYSYHSKSVEMDPIHCRTTITTNTNFLLFLLPVTSWNNLDTRVVQKKKVWQIPSDFFFITFLQYVFVFFNNLKKVVSSTEQLC